jgi:hypothetical protein
MLANSMVPYFDNKLSQSAIASAMIEISRLNILLGGSDTTLLVGSRSNTNTTTITASISETLLSCGAVTRR